jgi:hypothetical protein
MEVDEMEIDEEYPYLERLVAFGDSLTTGSKKGALIGLYKGVMYLINETHMLAVLIEVKEMKTKEDIAFRSNLFPNAQAPTDMSWNKKDIVFEWEENKTRRKNTIPREEGEGIKIVKSFKKFFSMKNAVTIPVESLNSIESGVSVLSLIMEKGEMLFRQNTLTGEEEIESRIDLKKSGGGGLGDYFNKEEKGKKKDCKVKISTKDFTTLPKLTDESTLQISLNGNDTPVSGMMRIGRLKARILIGTKIHEV